VFNLAGDIYGMQKYLIKAKWNRFCHAFCDTCCRDRGQFQFFLTVAIWCPQSLSGLTNWPKATSPSPTVTVVVIVLVAASMTETVR